MSKKLKNKEVIALYYALSILGNLQGIKFSYGINKNRQRLKREVDLIEGQNISSPEFLKYEKARLDINKDFALKEDDGTPKMTKRDNFNRYVINPDRLVTFTEEQEKLKVKYKKAISEKDKQLKEFKEFLDLENDFVPYYLSFEDIPKDVSLNQFEIISNFLEDNEE